MRSGINCSPLSKPGSSLSIEKVIVSPTDLKGRPRPNGIDRQSSVPSVLVTYHSGLHLRLPHQSQWQTRLRKTRTSDCFNCRSARAKKNSSVHIRREQRPHGCLTGGFLGLTPPPRRPLWHGQNRPQSPVFWGSCKRKRPTKKGQASGCLVAY